MDQDGTPTPLLTKAGLKDWLQVSDFWVRDRLENDPEFVRLCVVDLAPSGSSRRTLRFNVPAVERYLGIRGAAPGDTPTWASPPGAVVGPTRRTLEP